MFGNRRRRAASNPPLNGPNVNSNAAVAAAQAFLNNRTSNASLSSAAAAAALRSRPTTPTSVADVQTKRTIRRAGSVASTGSAGSGKPSLERRGSSSSMSERTFRDPSPLRSSQPVPSAVDAPPVPALPKNIRPAIPEKSHRRAASLDVSPVRVASPPPNKPSGRGSSLGPTMAPRNGRAGQRDSSLVSLQERGGTPSHRGSVNFSLPTSSRPASPIFTHRRLTSAPQRVKPPTITSPTNNSLVYDPNTRSFLPQAEVWAIEQRMYDAANAPVKKKKRVAPKQAVGTHLADKTMGAKPRGTAIDAMEAATVQKSVPKRAQESRSDRITRPEAVSRSVQESPGREKKKIVSSDSESDQASYIPNSSDGDDDYTTHATASHNQEGSPLVKKPSTVREEREREEEEDDTPMKAQQDVSKSETNTTRYRTTSPQTLPRSVAGRGKGRISPELDRQSQQSIPASDVTLEVPADELTPAAKGSIRGDRVNSVSPVRATHFAKSPSENLLVKHQPPPRSISPRKSALKHPGAARGSSPLASETHNGSISNESPEELAVPRKKANRVSFDETNVIVGSAAPTVTLDSPIVQSPQTRRSWFSISRGKKKEAPSFDDDDGQVMKPRPALPSFGSVREKKPQRDVTPERPLIKPTMTEGMETTVPSPPLATPPTAENVENPLGPSNDFIAGSILAQDAAMKNAANISKSREPLPTGEPLPPQVTSVEGNGYLSDTNSSVGSGDEFEDAEVNSPTENGKTGNGGLHIDTSQHTAENSTDLADLDEPDSKEEGVPGISITGATPTIEATEKMEEWPDMPGGWGDEHSDSEQNDPSTSAMVETPVATPAAVAPLSSPVLAGTSARHQTTAIIEESEESEGDSIYSDAAEELDGDGFMSLDAVVDSPIISTSGAETALTTPPDSPTSKATKERAYRQLIEKTGGPGKDDGWEKAQEYWRGLSTEKKRQLELEAEADSAPSSPTKPKKKAPVKSSPPASVPAPRQSAPNKQRTYMIAPGTKDNEQPIPLRSSMRPTPQDIPTKAHVRKSMRSPGVEPNSPRGSQSVEPRGTLQKRHLPTTRTMDEYKPDPEAVDAMIRKLTAQRAAAAMKQPSAPPAPTLRRKGSADSDSSFKRANKASPDVPRFRSSMRGSVDSGRKQSPIPASRFSLRSLSPGPTKRRPFSSNEAPPLPSSPQSFMRNSMRPSTSGPTLRGPPARAKSPIRLPGFSRSVNKAKKSQAKKSGSRFGDSSDEEDDRPAFRSRFNDSSDEDDEPLPPRSNGIHKTMPSNAPVRGIPRRFGTEDGDSSDLPDSDDERPIPNAAQAATTVESNGASKRDTKSNEGGILASGFLRRSGSGREAMSPVAANGSSTRPNTARRSSFMNILRRKKADPSSKVRKSGAESPARRDTPLERSRSDLATLKVSERPTSPKLQKRNPSERRVSGNTENGIGIGSDWPLAAPPMGDESRRPGTSGTADEPEPTAGGDDRPGLGNRRHTATGLGGVDILGVVPGRKKKKFGALRRMFRLEE
ncbi:hypothetical protein HYFRA_00002150 [Hymenoscyphus fraxineus]|uniref:Uncharacterized protein n=1 Tax=Hymenoscyphus fraxineus TaxID=746836 RepID=A0A9N9KN48_9HELO|nr:hypothetical protein HYFRA_00002150 [Hymenoscyphus fraxineus]